MKREEIIGELKMIGLTEEAAGECASSIKAGNGSWERILLDYRSEVLDSVHRGQDALSKIDVMTYRLRNMDE